MDRDFRGHDEAEELTGIPPRIQCHATPLEVMDLQIEAFLDALADVALSVAARSLATQQDEDAA